MPPPRKPLLIYDGDCGFCLRWVGRWKRITGSAIDYLPFQDKAISQQFPKIPREALETAVHLIEPDGSVTSGAEASFRALAVNPRYARLPRWYQGSRLFAKAAEAIYRLVARNRRLLSKLF